MTKTPVGSDVNQAFDVHRNFFSQVAFYFMFAFDEFTQFDDFILAKVFDARLVPHPRFLEEMPAQ